MTANFRLSNPIHFLALGFGSGLLKPAPGTWGTLAAIPLYGLIVFLLPANFWAYVSALIATFVAGVYFCGKTARDVGVHDHPSIVWDEFVGFFITMTAIPVSWQTILLGFVLFRIFDIVKPWPIKLLDKHVHGGFGIMIDDVMAGVFAWLILFLIYPYIA